jgi:hypothetical protein
VKYFRVSANRELIQVQPERGHMIHFEGGRGRGYIVFQLRYRLKKKRKALLTKTNLKEKLSRRPR